MHRPYLLYLILGENSTLAVDFSRDRMLVDLLCQGIGRIRSIPFLRLKQQRPHVLLFIFCFLCISLD